MPLVVLGGGAEGATPFSAGAALWEGADAHSPQIPTKPRGAKRGSNTHRALRDERAKRRLALQIAGANAAQGGPGP